MGLIYECCKNCSNRNNGVCNCVLPLHSRFVEDNLPNERPYSTLDEMWGNMYLDAEKNAQHTEQILLENAQLKKEIEELKANQTPTRKRLNPKNYDKLNLADKLRYKEKQVRIAREREQEQTELRAEQDAYAECVYRHDICEEVEALFMKIYNAGGCEQMVYDMFFTGLDAIRKGEYR